MALAKTIILVGPPGSGKGTQADLIARELDGIHFSSGQILREMASDKVKREMQEGELVTENEVGQILEASLQQADPNKVWLLDGYIRLEKDRLWLATALARLGRSIDLVIIIEADEETCKERILSRGRNDDTSQAWMERWEEYIRITRPVIATLEVLPHFRVGGASDPKVIHNEIMIKLADYGVSAR